MKIVTLRPDQFEKFASNHRYRSFYQTSQYGTLMSKHGYKAIYIGYDECNLVEEWILPFHVLITSGK